MWITGVHWDRRYKSPNFKQVMHMEQTRPCSSNKKSSLSNLRERKSRAEEEIESEIYGWECGRKDLSPHTRAHKKMGKSPDGDSNQ